MIACFMSVQVLPAFGQMAGPSNPSQSEASRVSGSSFGSQDEKAQQVLPYIPLMEGNGPQSLNTLSYQVHILGEVLRPGTYRVPASTRLSEAIQIAGGMMERGSDRRIELRRGGGSRRADLLGFKIFGNLDANPYLMDNDVIFVPLRKTVIQIEGAVKRPGVYELQNEKTIKDVMKLAGGISIGNDDPAPIRVIRFENGKKNVLNVENSEQGRRAFRVQNGDVIILPQFLIAKKSFDYNVSKIPGDNKLFYPSYEERVFVLGAVAKPGPYPFNPYYDLRQYLTLAGGTNKLAKSKKIKIISALGSTTRANNQTEINPGDTIVVPERYMAPESLVSLIVGIASSIVGTTAVILSVTK